MRGMLIAAGTFAFTALAVAQDAPPAADPTAAARAAYGEFRAIRKQTNAEKDDAKKEKLEKQATAAFERFCAQFDKVDWNEWDVATDVELAGLGINHAAARAFDAEDFATARKGWEFLAERLEPHPTNAYFVASQLPDVYAASGALDDGAAFLKRCRDRFPKSVRALVSIGLCDLLAAKSDFDGAQKARADAKQALDAAETSSSADDVTARAHATLAKFRLEGRSRVGEKVPDLSGADTATGKPFALSSAAGKPALCHVFGLIGSPDPDVFRTLTAVQKKCAKDGLVVVAMTSFDLVSPLTKVEAEVEMKMPRNADDKVGDKVMVTRDGFRKQMETYRQRFRCSFPFVVAADKGLAPFADYVKTSTILLDAEQRIVVEATRLDRHSIRWIAQALCARAAAARAAPPK